jgi:hypothetical protein
MKIYRKDSFSLNKKGIEILASAPAPFEPLPGLQGYGTIGKFLAIQMKKSGIRLATTGF